MEKTETGLEIKATTGAGDVDGMFNTFMSAFETFKQENDDRLKKIERRGNVDVLTEQKLDRLNAVLDGQKSAMDRALL